MLRSLEYYRKRNVPKHLVYIYFCIIASLLPIGIGVIIIVVVIVIIWFLLASLTSLMLLVDVDGILRFNLIRSFG